MTVEITAKALAKWRSLEAHIARHGTGPETRAELREAMADYWRAIIHTFGRIT